VAVLGTSRLPHSGRLALITTMTVLSDIRAVPKSRAHRGRQDHAPAIAHTGGEPADQQHDESDHGAPEQHHHDAAQDDMPPDPETVPRSQPVIVELRAGGRRRSRRGRGHDRARPRHRDGDLEPCHRVLPSHHPMKGSAGRRGSCSASMNRPGPSDAPRTGPCRGASGIPARAAGDGACQPQPLPSGPA